MSKYSKQPQPSWGLFLCGLALGLLGCAHQVAAPAPEPEVLPPPRPVAPTPVAKPEPPPSVPMHVLAGAIEPLRSDDPTLPDELMASSRGKTLDGSYKMCIATDGSVSSVTPVVSIAGADESIVSTLKTWKFPEIPTGICKVQTLSFEIP